jgi:hypothetical protein
VDLTKKSSPGIKERRKILPSNEKYLAIRWLEKLMVEMVMTME